MNIDLTQFSSIISHSTRRGYLKPEHDYPVVTINDRFARFNSVSSRSIEDYKYIEIKQSGCLLLFALRRRKPSNQGQICKISKKNSNYTISFVALSKEIFKGFDNKIGLDLAKYNYQFMLQKADDQDYIIDLNKPISNKPRKHRIVRTQEVRL